MRSLSKLVGAAALALVAMAFVGVASASAQFSEYSHNGSPLMTTHNVTFEIEPLDPNGVSDLQLTDTNVLGSPLTVTCDQADVVVASGTVSPGGVGTVTAAEAVDCDSSNPALCPTPDAEAFNIDPLGWDTDLAPTTDNRIDIEAAGGGATGFVVTCENGVVDECTIPANTSDADAEVSEAPGFGPGGQDGVRATFDDQTPDADCTIGGPGTGQARGSIVGLYNDGHDGGLLP